MKFIEEDEKRLGRRELLKLSPLLALSAFAFPSVQRRTLAIGRETSSSAFAAFAGGTLAPTFNKSELTPFELFPVNSYLTEDPGVDSASWRLTVSGEVSNPGEYTLAQIQSLPRVEQITQHICIEGWSVIGSFAGARLSDFLKLIGASPDARFLQFECADDYYEFLELPAANHPQTLLCYEMYGQALTPTHGFPLRLQMPTKLGYKQAKHLVEMRVTRLLEKRRAYWVDQGYPAFGGL